LATRYLKAWAGYGPGGTNVTPPTTPGLLGRLNPVRLATRPVTKAVERLDQSGAIGHAAAVGLRGGKSMLTINPLRPALDMVRPGLGRAVTPAAVTSTVGYGGYRAARALPDQVDSELRAAGVTDEKLLDDQWWRVMGAQPQLLYQAAAPGWLGGDRSPIGRAPRRFLSNLVTTAPRRATSDPSYAPPDSPFAYLKAPKAVLPTPGTVARQTALHNLNHNLHEGLPDVTYDTAKAVGADVAKNPWATLRSPMLWTLADSIHPELATNPEHRRAVFRALVGGEAAPAVDANAVATSPTLRARVGAAAGCARARPAAGSGSRGRTG
jgi:hypothetical protein